MNSISIVQLVVAIMLVVAILLQHRSSGLGASLGGGMDGSYYTRRGFEKFLVQATVVLAVVFITISLAQIFV
jgi:protein translocase SecG subunit